ncbi:hypothetical protein AB4Y63_09560 [Leifsonia sp. YAF41]|uniref:hypothetical protein n=1 Tax=Leifsonia sp. YAF41 TaxID=3233086 RepID=UPI003F973EEA
MRARIAASVVLAAGILLGTSACNLFAPQATTIHYDASDGVSGNVGDLAIRNAIVISDNGELGNLLVTVVNSGKTSQDLKIQYEAKGGKKVSQEVEIPANSSIPIGDPGYPSVQLERIDTIPGALLPMFFQYGEETGVELLVPVLTNQLPQYKTLAPTPEPVATQLPAVTPTAEPTAEPTTAP